MRTAPIQLHSADQILFTAVKPCTDMFAHHIAPYTPSLTPDVYTNYRACTNGLSHWCMTTWLCRNKGIIPGLCNLTSKPLTIEWLPSAHIGLPPRWRYATLQYLTYAHHDQPQDIRKCSVCPPVCKSLLTCVMLQLLYDL